MFSFIPPHDDEDDDPTIAGSAAAAAAAGGGRGANVLPTWGNLQTMNINPLIVTNIQSSPYFKTTLFGLKTYHEVIDEIYYRVSHLEPWERGKGWDVGTDELVRRPVVGQITDGASIMNLKVSFLRNCSGSRKTSGQTGMCGGVRGVGAGGIVSSAYCLLFKLGTLKLTRKQVNGLINHGDSPYIRGLGFMYIR